MLKKGTHVVDSEGRMFRVVESSTPPLEKNLKKRVKDSLSSVKVEVGSKVAIPIVVRQQMKLGTVVLVRIS